MTLKRAFDNKMRSEYTLKKALLVVLLAVSLISTSLIWANRTAALPDALAGSGLSVEEATLVRERAVVMDKIDVILKRVESDPDLAKLYAGYYLDENGALVVNFTQTVDLGRELKLADTRFNKVTFSDIELDSITLALHNAMMSSSGREDWKISYFLKDSRKNRVLVCVDSMDKEVLDRIRALGNPEMVEFKLETGKITLVSNIVNGKVTGGVGYTDRCTIGFRARRYVNGSYQYGFITSAHIDPIEGTDFVDNIGENGSGTLVGTMRKKVRNNTVDASFIQAAFLRTPSKTFMNGDSYAYILQDVRQELFVEAYGYKSGKKTGYILNNLWSGWCGAQYMYDMVQASFPAQEGDSGAAITYWNYTGSASAVRCVTGVLVSTSTEGWSIFGKVNSVLTELGAQDY